MAPSHCIEVVTVTKRAATAIGLRSHAEREVSISLPVVRFGECEMTTDERPRAQRALDAAKGSL